MEKIAFIVDGGYFTKKYKKIYKAFPDGDKTEKYITDMFLYIRKGILKDVPCEIYRIFYYDCKPLNNILTNPVDGSEYNLSKSGTYKNNQKLQSDLVRKNYFALRFGTLKIEGYSRSKKKGAFSWEVKVEKLMELRKRHLEGKDLRPQITQKGVDMKMGLDIASITSKKLCTKIVLVSGDTDMIPAMKTARKEGVQVYLHTFDSVSNIDLATHADVIISHKDILENVTR